MTPQTFVRSSVLACALSCSLAGASAQQAPAPAGAPAGEAALAAASLPPERDNYRIGAGDVIEIRVLGQEQMSVPTVKVSDAGYIRSPFVDDDIRAQCLTERELSEAIADKLKKYLKYPEVHVAVKEYNSMPVAVMGAVNAPGRFKMERRVRLIELLTYASGIKSDAGKVLHLIHLSGTQTCDLSGTISALNEDAIEVINVTKLMDGDLREDRVIRPGDIVIVPVADQIFIAGEVLKPNAYQLRDGMTFTQALALAGGPSPIAKINGMRIVRQEPGKPRQEIPVDLKAIQSNKAPDPLLMANDLIEVPDSTGKKFLRGVVSAIGGSAGQLPIRVIP